MALRNKTMTSENYMKRGGMGPMGCPFCYQAAELVDHLLVTCLYTMQLWNEVAHRLGINGRLHHGNLDSILFLWSKHSSYSPTDPLFFIWCIWKYINLILFEERIQSALHRSNIFISFLLLFMGIIPLGFLTGQINLGDAVQGYTSFYLKIITLVLLWVVVKAVTHGLSYFPFWVYYIFQLIWKLPL